MAVKWAVSVRVLVERWLDVVQVTFTALSLSCFPHSLFKQQHAEYYLKTERSDVFITYSRANNFQLFRAHEC